MARARKTHRLSLEAFVLVNGGLLRVANLVSIYDHVSKSLPQKRRAPASDILRAAVVLLHATMEEYIRHVVGSLLPLAPEQKLDVVPLLGYNRQAKFSLGALTHFRGKTIDAVIDTSVQEYLSTRSFNSLQDIIQVFDGVGIKLSAPAVRPKTIQALIRRRHQIAHEADEVRERRP